MSLYGVTWNKKCNTKWLKGVYLCKCTHFLNIFVFTCIFDWWFFKPNKVQDDITLKYHKQFHLGMSIYDWIQLNCSTARTLQILRLILPLDTRVTIDIYIYEGDHQLRCVAQHFHPLSRTSHIEIAVRYSAKRDRWSPYLTHARAWRDAHTSFLEIVRWPSPYLRFLAPVSFSFQSQRAVTNIN